MSELNITDFPDIAERAKELGCRVPSAIALLPRNFHEAETKSELMHESSAPTVRSLWRQSGIIETPLEHEGERFPVISEHGLVEWIGPTILVTTGWLSQNPEVMAVGLGVVSEYLSDIFRGFIPKPIVKLSVVVQKANRTSKRIDYEGPVEGLKDLPAIIKRTSE